MVNLGMIFFCLAFYGYSSVFHLAVQTSHVEKSLTTATGMFKLDVLKVLKYGMHIFRKYYIRGKNLHRLTYPISQRLSRTKHGKRNNLQGPVNMSLSKAIEVVSGINDFGNLFELAKPAVSYLSSQWNGVQEQRQIQEHEVLQLQSDLRGLSETLPSMYSLFFLRRM
jgi:hypothetical protein